MYPKPSDWTGGPDTGYWLQQGNSRPTDEDVYDSWSSRGVYCGDEIGDYELSEHGEDA